MSAKKPPGKRSRKSANFPIDEIQGMLNRIEDKFDDRFNRVEDRLEKLDDKIETVSKVTDRNTVVLEEHQRRALANEKHANLLEQKLDLHRQEMNSTLKSHEEASTARSKELEGKQKDLAESVEIFTKLPAYLYKVAKWLAAISAGGAALWAIGRFALHNLSQ